MIFTYRARVSVIFLIFLTGVIWLSLHTPTHVKVKKLLCKQQLELPQKWISGQLEKVDFATLKGRQQSDQFLINYLRHFHLYPPSNLTRRYSKLYAWRTKYIQESRDAIKTVQKYLKNKTGGIFVEAGASNGADELSNTLLLEQVYNWTGLLVEGSPLVFPRLRAAHRKCWISDLLLSSHTYADLVVFNQGANIYGGMITNGELQRKIVEVVNEKGKQEFVYELLAVPLFSLVRALNFKIIDYLSLDVEGSEFQILKTFPFDEVLIQTMTVEISFIKDEQKQELIDFLGEKGFVKVGEIGGVPPRDFIFVQRSLVDEKNAAQSKRWFDFGFFGE